MPAIRQTLHVIHKVRPYVAVEPSTSSDLYGKAATALQENVEVEDGVVSGTLKYVTGYTGYSGETEEQSGNYLAVTVSTDNDESVITGRLLDRPSRVITLENDEDLVIRVTSTEQKLELTVTGPNGLSRTQVFAFSDLTLTPAPTSG